MNNNKKAKNKGFTLIEIIAVVIIIGIIALIAVPSVSGYIANSRNTTYKAHEKTMEDRLAGEIIDAAKIGKKAIDSGDEENWSEKQRKEYEMQYDIHELIKQDIDSLQQLYKKRAEYETYLAKDAEDLKKEYADKKISKAEYLSKWRELEYQLKQVTEELALEERAYQLNIIAGSKEVKESYKRAPK